MRRRVGEVLVPAELQNVPLRVLEGYVRERVATFTGDPGFAAQLGVRPEAVAQATADTFARRAAAEAAAADQGHKLKLVFNHDCLNLGCNDEDCKLCEQNQKRRCDCQFASKYLAGDILKAKCSAVVRIEVLDCYTGKPVVDDRVANIRLEMCILDGRKYAELDVGHETEEELDECMLLLNGASKELLAAGRGAQHDAEKKVILPLVRGVAVLPELSVTGSSEAMLSGQKPPFRLLVRAVLEPDGVRARHIRHAVSEAFVVATPRVRTAVKADIPHLEDHVSKLHAVGNQTQQKLLDINGACEAAGMAPVRLPHNCVTKVGQFRDIVEVAERNRDLCETLKKVLKLAKGWELARDHARSAVGTDNRMRLWYTGPDMSLALLYKAELGAVDLASPVGMVSRTGVDASGCAHMECSLVAAMSGADQEVVARLQRDAAACWWEPGHPGWEVWQSMNSDDFMHEMAGTASTRRPAKFVVPLAPELAHRAAAAAPVQGRMRAGARITSDPGVYAGPSGMPPPGYDAQLHHLGGAVSPLASPELGGGILLRGQQQQQHQQQQRQQQRQLAEMHQQQQIAQQRQRVQQQERLRQATWNTAPLDAGQFSPIATGGHSPQEQWGGPLYSNGLAGPSGRAAAMEAQAAAQRQAQPPQRARGRGVVPQSPFAQADMQLADRLSNSVKSRQSSLSLGASPHLSPAGTPTIGGGMAAAAQHHSPPVHPAHTTANMAAAAAAQNLSPGVANMLNSLMSRGQLSREFPPLSVAGSDAMGNGIMGPLPDISGFPSLAGSDLDLVMQMANQLGSDADTNKFLAALSHEASRDVAAPGGSGGGGIVGGGGGEAAAGQLRQPAAAGGGAGQHTTLPIPSTLPSLTMPFMSDSFTMPRQSSGIANMLSSEDVTAEPEAGAGQGYEGAPATAGPYHLRPDRRRFGYMDEQEALPERMSGMSMEDFGPEEGDAEEPARAQPSARSAVKRERSPSRSG